MVDYRPELNSKAASNFNGMISPVKKELMSFSALRDRICQAHKQFVDERKEFKQKLDNKRHIYTEQYINSAIEKDEADRQNHIKEQRESFKYVLERIVNNRQAAIDDFYSAVPDGRTIDLLQLMSMRKDNTITLRELEALVSRCQTSYQAMKNAELICEANGYGFKAPINIEESVKNVTDAEERLANAISWMGTEYDRIESADARQLLNFWNYQRKDEAGDMVSTRTADDDWFDSVDCDPSVSVPQSTRTLLQKLEDVQTEAVENKDESAYKAAAKFAADHEAELMTDADRERQYKALEAEAEDKGIIE